MCSADARAFQISCRHLNENMILTVKKYRLTVSDIPPDRVRARHGGRKPMIKLFLCDDNCLHLKYTASYLATLPLCAAFDIQTFSAPQELLAELQSGNTPDIAVLDVEMPKIDGLSLAKRLNRRHFSARKPVRQRPRRRFISRRLYHISLLYASVQLIECPFIICMYGCVFPSRRRPRGSLRRSPCFRSSRDDRRPVAQRLSGRLKSRAEKLCRSAARCHRLSKEGSKVLRRGVRLWQHSAIGQP